LFFFCYFWASGQGRLTAAAPQHSSPPAIMQISPWPVSGERERESKWVRITSPNSLHYTRINTQQRKRIRKWISQRRHCGSVFFFFISLFWLLFGRRIFFSLISEKWKKPKNENEDKERTCSFIHSPRVRASVCVCVCVCDGAHRRNEDLRANPVSCIYIYTFHTTAAAIAAEYLLLGCTLGRISKDPINIFREKKKTK
jgi:hypothetical protein